MFEPSITTHNLSTVPHPATELFGLIPRPLSFTATALLRALIEAGSAAPAVRAIGVDAVLVDAGAQHANAEAAAPVRARRPRGAQLAQHARHLLDAEDAVGERVAVALDDLVLDGDVVELLLEAGVEATFARVGQADVVEGGPAGAKDGWDGRVGFNGGGGALEEQLVRGAIVDWGEEIGRGGAGLDRLRTCGCVWDLALFGVVEVGHRLIAFALVEVAFVFLGGSAAWHVVAIVRGACGTVAIHEARHKVSPWRVNEGATHAGAELVAAVGCGGNRSRD